MRSTEHQMAARQRLFALLRGEEAPRPKVVEPAPEVLESRPDQFDFGAVRDGDQIALHLAHKLHALG